MEISRSKQSKHFKSLFYNIFISILLPAIVKDSYCASYMLNCITGVCISKLKKKTHSTWYYLRFRHPHFWTTQTRKTLGNTTGSVTENVTGLGKYPPQSKEELLLLWQPH